MPVPAPAETPVVAADAPWSGARLAWLAIGLAFSTIVLFWPAVNGGFVNYDDPDYLSANRHVQAGLCWDSVVWAFTTGHASNWHPVSWLSHLLDWQLFGNRPWGHHLVSVLWHGLNAALVFLALRALTGSVWRSVAVAAVFAWHPLRVESVAWLSERKDVVSTAFWLLAMLAYASYAKSLRASGRQGWSFLVNPYYLLTGLCLALGLMAKPMLVTLPCVLLLLDFWPLRRTPWLPAEEIPGEKDAVPRPPPAGPGIAWLVLEKVPLFALVVLSSAITFLVQRAGGAVSPLTGLPLPARLGNAVVAYGRYLLKWICPTDLAVLYPHPGHWPWPAILVGLAALAVLSLGAWRLRCRQPWLLVGWLWFLGTLVPVIGVVQVGIQSMADRYTYVPMIGLAIAVVWGLTYMAARSQGWRSLLPVVAVLFAMFCLVMTREQIAYWRDSEALFLRTVAVTKNNYLAYNNLGFDYSNQGRVDEARQMYERSLAINPNYEEARNNLGYALAKLGRPAEAVPHYEMAIRLKPNLAEAHNNLGNAYADLGRSPEAMECYRRALAIKPDHPDAHNNLGIALAMQGKFAEAIEHLETSLRLKPGNASAEGNLGNAYAVQRKFEEAARHYAAALALNPQDAQTHNNLGNILAEQGKVDEAVAHYEQALALNAQNPEAQFNLGMMKLRREQPAEAARCFREALRLKPDYAEARKQLDAVEARGK